MARRRRRSRWAQELALPTTYHLLNTLVDKGFLTKDVHRRFILGWSVSILAQTYLRGRAVPERLLSAVRRRRSSRLQMATKKTAAGGEFAADELSPPTADAELYLVREAAIYQLSLAGQAAPEIIDAELRREFFVKGLVGFAGVATGFLRSVRRWTAAGT